MLEPYPEIPSRFDEKPAPAVDRGALSNEFVSPPVGWFALKAPVGWRVETDPRKGIVVATRDGRMLNEIKVEFRRHARAFRQTGQEPARDSSPDQLSQLYVAELNGQGLDDLQIIEISHDERLAGRAAFGVRFSHRLPAFLGGARIERVTIGAAVPAGLLLSGLSAPQLDYFAHALPHFEESTRTIELVPRRSLR